MADFVICPAVVGEICGEMLTIFRSLSLFPYLSVTNKAYSGYAGHVSLMMRTKRPLMKLPFFLLFKVVTGAILSVTTSFIGHYGGVIVVVPTGILTDLSILRRYEVIFEDDCDQLLHFLALRRSRELEWESYNSVEYHL